MSNFLSDFITELTTICAAATGLTVATSSPRNVFTSIQGTRESFIEGIRDGTIQTTGLFIDVGDFKEASDLALNQIGLQNAPTRLIYYLPWGPTGKQSLVYAAAWAIKSVIDARPCPGVSFTRVEEGQIMTNVDAPINAALGASSNSRIIAAAVVYQPGLRVQLYND